MDLPYAKLKNIMCEQSGKGLHLYQSNWRQISKYGNLLNYVRIIDTCRSAVYYKPMITTNSMKYPANYFVQGSVQFTSEYIERKIKKRVYVQANTVEGNYLIVLETMPADTFQLMNITYTTFASEFAKATRPVNDDDRQVHWVWFRKPNYKLTEEIVLRCSSWIELNPGYTFHLWTSIKDQDECMDFLGNLPETMKQYILDHIQFHYENEFRDLIMDWLSVHIPELVTLFQKIWESKERQDTIMKTDYTRNIILLLKGGIYTDFNDLVCLAPIETVLQCHAGQYIGVTDNTSENNASNYFMYASKNNEEWLSIVKQCTATMPYIHTLIHDEAAFAEAKACITSMIQLEYVPESNDSLFMKNICYALEVGLPEPIALSFKELRKKRPVRGVPNPSPVLDIRRILRENATIIQEYIQTDKFAKDWRFARTDIHLNPIMHRTNLPIFCRQNSIPIYMLPFSYIHRYHCLLSYVGHIGDATSYGNALRPNNSIKDFFV